MAHLFEISKFCGGPIYDIDTMYSMGWNNVQIFGYIQQRKQIWSIVTDIAVRFLKDTEIISDPVIYKEYNECEKVMEVHIEDRNGNGIVMKNIDTVRALYDGLRELEKRDPATILADSLAAMDICEHV